MDNNNELQQEVTRLTEEVKRLTGALEGRQSVIGGMMMEKYVQPLQAVAAAIRSLRPPAEIGRLTSLEIAAYAIGHESAREAAARLVAVSGPVNAAPTQSPSPAPVGQGLTDIEARTERIRLSQANSDSKGKIQLRHEVECLLAHIALLRSPPQDHDQAKNLATSGHDATGAVWKLVPIEPTDEVIRATASCLDDERCDCRWKVYNDDGSIRCKECAEQAAEQYRMGVEAAPDGAAATAPSEADKLDAARLDWVLANRTMRVQGSDANGWCVLDCSNGLTFLVQHAKTSREAIDAGMKKFAAEPAQPAEGL